MLLLLHGLGATAAVWEGFTSEPHVAPDLPGHGAAAALPSYSFETMATAVAAELDPSVQYDVLGHSLGGVLALVLADGLLQVRRVVALGVKVSWSDEDLARASALAERTQATFATRAEAVDRHLALAGLRGLVAPHSVTDGVVEVADGWRPALDLRAFGVGRPDLAGLLARCRAEVLMARGERDPMVTEADLLALDVDTVTLPGLGHSAHVEDPAAVRALLTA